MKILKTIVLLLVISIVAVIVTATFFLGGIVRTQLTTIGPKLMGVPVSLANAQISLLTGHIRLTQLEIGNPPDFKTSHAFKVGILDVQLVPKSLFSKRIVIKTIAIEAPDIVYEQTLAGNNFGQIMANLKGAPPAADKPAKEPAQSGGRSKTRIEIGDLRIDNGQLNVSLPGMGSAAAPIPFPNLHVTNIGKDEKGATIDEVVAQVFTAISEGVTQALRASGNIAGNVLENTGKTTGAGAKMIGETAKDAGKTLGDTSTKALGEIKGMLGGK
ncbi:MAG: AsmA family protein [Kiritimatiellia bacterium]